MNELDTMLRELQLTQLEILKIIDDFCRENDIKYSLYAGSLLGAVRHQGFIPWDDDLDICMERSEYDKFIKEWMTIAPKGYILQNKDIDPEFTQSFTKIRKDHTTFLQSDDKKGKYHTGIFVDVFPIDRMPNGKFARKLFKFRCMLYQLFTREFVPSRAGKFSKMVTSILLKCTSKNSRKKLRSELLKQITRNNDNRSLNTAAIETMASLKTCFPSDMLDAYVFLKFEDGEFMCFKDWDEHLKCKFGDYMKLPPEEERAWKHHPLIIDFERNYEEIK